MAYSGSDVATQIEALKAEIHSLRRLIAVLEVQMAKATGSLEQRLNALETLTNAESGIRRRSGRKTAKIA